MIATSLDDAVGRLLAGENHAPHELLGPHAQGTGTVVRVFHPEASAVSVVWGGTTYPAERIHDAGLFAASLPAKPDVLGAYRLAFTGRDHSWEADDPYRFLPTLGELDLYLIGEGRHRELWRRLGAREMEHQGARGVAFSVWAPNARGIHVVSDANFWDERLHPMRSLGGSGVWELFIPGAEAGARYKFRVTRNNGQHVLKADPLARRQEVAPATASIVDTSGHTWNDSAWMQRRARVSVLDAPLAIYEVHLGSWRRTPDNHPLSYRDVAPLLAAYCNAHGFTHVELLPIAEHPFTGSWGYQVTSYYAPTSRYGTPDDFRWFVDCLHQAGIGVIMDWVPAHFPRDDWALARFDGTALYEHADPKLGEHPDWGTLIFNYGRNEVRNFLVANARYWAEEFHIDGLRVDAVASMLYLNYSRQPGEWIPNRYGGNENLDAIDFLREVNEVMHADYPGAIMAAEESTAWPGVTRPTSSGGLGFTFKWNMGWMHDTLAYISKDPIYRRYHHHQLTFGLWYAWSENFILPLSHDEVVHGKGSLIGKMSGDGWQKFANLRSLLAWMWAHPGKKLLFMGQEFGQGGEWSHDHSLDWHLLEDSLHSGVQRLMKDIGKAYHDLPALFERDTAPDGFHWIDAGNVDQNILSFMRLDAHGHPGTVCVSNFSPLVHHSFRQGLPRSGEWREVINTDAYHYGGSGQGNLGVVRAEPIPFHGMADSALITLPPLATLWLTPR